MEVRRLFLLYLSSQILNFVLILGLEFIVLKSFSDNGQGDSMIILGNFFLLCLLALINLAMFLTLLEAYIDKKIKVFNRIVVVNYITYSLLILSPLNYIFASIISIIVGILIIKFSQKIYEDWVLQEFYND